MLPFLLDSRRVRAEEGKRIRKIQAAQRRNGAVTSRTAFEKAATTSRAQLQNEAGEANGRCENDHEVIRRGT